MQKKDLWNTTVFQTSPIIQQLRPLTQFFDTFEDWPKIADYKARFVEQGLKITPVPQSGKINTFEEQYEPRVYLKKELQTRTCNWHDFFNAMIWLRFPRTKKTLNHLHFNKASKRSRGSNRSWLENKITQFDECGAVLICKDNKLLKLVEQHQWQSLFIDNADKFKNSFECVIFGHAIFEKALSPYIGLTCHCLMIADEKLLEKIKNGHYTELDSHLAEIWEEQLSRQRPQFQPFPILGLPGYWPQQNMDFYKNTSYFRKKPEKN
ncbi:hypothetical protein MNBD_GAMMA09-3389 [hydrothermal vent metagenome]|uniref:Transmembrane protein n=1 Tax=hydrothermal vent metagenome TaxID=652676 RepID=A0A3B0Y361_9ZZZZ